MRLTTYTDYAMRTLIYLALNDDKLSTIANVAVAYDISENHLMKVVHFLGQQNYVQTVRGRNGGLRLARPAEEINLGRLIRNTESQDGLLECVNSQSDCCIQSACKLIGILCEAELAMFAVFEKYVLADLLAHDNQLKNIFITPRVAKTPHIFAT